MSSFLGWAARVNPFACRPRNLTRILQIDHSATIAWRSRAAGRSVLADRYRISGRQLWPSSRNGLVR